MGIRVFLADDHKMLRDGLRSLIERAEGLEIVGVAGNGRVAVQKVIRLVPEVVVMDLSMPDLNGVEATRQILGASPNVKVIALSIHADKQSVTRMLASGARGYLLKTNAFEELIDAIHVVSGGGVYLTPKIADVVVNDYVQYLETETKEDLSMLTPREQEVLQLLAEGKASKEIAFRLNISIKTVDTHRHHIMQKLVLRSLPELTKYAIRTGLTSLDY